MTASTDVSTTPRIEQVGGDHYASAGLQHWDLCVAADLPYLPSAASKYVARHRRKNGREDLEKAISYLERHLLAVDKYQYPASNNRGARLVGAQQFMNWISDARMEGRDTAILHDIMCAGNSARAVVQIRKVIEEEYPVNPVYGLTEDVQAAAARLAAIKPGTPEDGGHHERGILLPREITQFWYDHRLDPSMRTYYKRNASSCRWELQETETPGVTGYDLATEDA